MENSALEFMNSQWHDWRGSGRCEDRLDRPGWLEAFLEKWELQAPMPPQPHERAALGELRQAMRAITECVCSNSEPDRADIARLNEAMAGVPSLPVLAREEGGWRLERRTGDRGWAAVMGQVAVAFARLLAEEDARRLKMCANEDCRWVFFDESRSRTARWCDDKMCGNLMKVRRFRKRRKEND
ncbi:CGNR zinc finger domain-containing protein [Paenibacillus chitinolyticus]|uniref:CGNR zinc finger domain-containing protein n=1 Tax=Paenibacillus chitinolyticus TaxID=79263 RepID=UPI002DBD6C23|nr:ABATE domain-containing protein [Paenibacillus chitinolyticus]MEC0244462.1 CGNR zinc finger domain-containing protein [Paenibacillus chitinolyticus]